MLIITIMIIITIIIVYYYDHLLLWNGSAVFVCMCPICVHINWRIAWCGISWTYSIMGEIRLSLRSHGQVICYFPKVTIIYVTWGPTTLPWNKSSLLFLAAFECVSVYDDISRTAWQNMIRLSIPIPGWNLFYSCSNCPLPRNIRTVLTGPVWLSFLYCFVLFLRVCLSTCPFVDIIICSVAEFSETC